MKKATREDFPELYSNTFQCECCGNEFDLDCEAEPDLCFDCSIGEIEDDDY